MTRIDLDAARKRMFDQGKIIIDGAIAEAVAAERERIRQRFEREATRLAGEELTVAATVLRSFAYIIEPEARS